MRRISQIATTCAIATSANTAAEAKNQALRPKSPPSQQTSSTPKPDNNRRALLSRMLAKPDPSANIEKKRLEEAISFFSAKPYITPDELEVYKKAIECDNNSLPHVIAAENARNPGLNLHYAGSIDDLKKLIAQAGDQHIRVVMRQPLPYEHHHYIAADITQVDGKTSVVFVDSLEQSDDQSAWAVHLMNEQLPKDVAVSYLMTDQEKAWVGCHIFSLSFATKMKDFENELRDVHAMNVRDAEHRNQPVADEMAGKHVLPGHFFKHAQSSKVIGDAIAARGENPIVNKKDQTLIQRHIAYRDTDGKSTSIDKKRLTLYRRAAKFSEEAAYVSQVLAPAFEPLLKSPNYLSSRNLTKDESDAITRFMEKISAAACNGTVNLLNRKGEL